MLSRSLLLLLGCSWIGSGSNVVAASWIPLVDSSGSLKRNIPTVSTSGGLVVLISSPGTPSPLERYANDKEFLSLEKEEGPSPPLLSCRGSTLRAASNAERVSLTTSSLIAGAVIVDGVTEGDIEMGLRNSRHSRTLTALFRARQELDGDTSKGKQTLLLGVLAESVEDEAAVLKEIENIFDAAAEELTDSKPTLTDLYNVQIVAINTEADATKVLAVATESAKAGDAVEEGSLAKVLSSVHARVLESGVTSVGLDPPMVAQAFLACREAYAQQSRTIRAKLAAWRSRCSRRGLVVDNFGAQATALYRSTLDQYDTTTLFVAGIPLVAGQRLESRAKLMSLLETSIQELYETQVTNLRETALKKLTNKMLRVTTSSAESDLDRYNAALREIFLSFSVDVESLEVPSMGIVKDKALTETERALNEAVRKFPDSPRAKLQRNSVVTKTTSRQRKPSSRSVDVGLDLVAMLRPDGFGSLQGFLQYQLAGNSITVGIHNDADDPQTISQNGGVRPSLLRVQPKLRVDVEL